MAPTIGITVSMKGEDTFFVYKNYVDAVVQAGGTPFLLPIIKDKDVIHRMALNIDGLLLTGGGDIDPHLFGEEPISGLGEVSPDRDLMELEMIRTCVRENKPIFGICRGCQVLNVFFGGDLYQDLLSQKKNVLQHTQNSPWHHPTHSITIKTDSILFKIMKTSLSRVNSFHHQAVREVPSPLQISAVAKDNVIEAIEVVNQEIAVLGVQWHPERMMHEDKNSQALFIYFVKECMRRSGK